MKKQNLLLFLSLSFGCLLITYHPGNTQTIAAGANHTLYRCGNGTGNATGSGMYGQLGNVNFGDSNFPLPVSTLSGITSLAAGQYHSLFQKNDGTVWSCGVNGNGQLGLGTTSNSATPLQVTALNNNSALSAGMFHSLFLKTNGTVWACGENTQGQLGNATFTGSPLPVQVSLANSISEIAAGFNHSLFKQNDSTVWACGANSYGQLGNLSNTISNVPVTAFELCKPASGINEAEADAFGITVMPNPGNGVVIFQSDREMTNCELKIVNMYGETFFSIPLNDYRTTIDLSKHPKGIYFYQVYDQVNRRTAGRIVVQ